MPLPTPTTMWKMGKKKKPTERRTKHLDAAVKAVDAERRRMRFVASQQVVDRDGEVVVARGIDTSDFQRNPVLLVDHDRTFVLGSVDSLVLEARSGGDALIGSAVILPAGTSGRIDEAWGAIRGGARNGISIGFLLIEADPRPVLPGQRGATLKATRLLEISSVSLPSCQTCLIEAKSAKSHGGAWAPAPALTRQQLTTLIHAHVVQAVEGSLPRFQEHLARVIRHHRGLVD